MTFLPLFFSKCEVLIIKIWIMIIILFLFLKNAAKWKTMNLINESTLVIYKKKYTWWLQWRGQLWFFSLLMKNRIRKKLEAIQCFICALLSLTCNMHFCSWKTIAKIRNNIYSWNNTGNYFNGFLNFSAGRSAESDWELMRNDLKLCSSFPDVMIWL